MKNRVGSRFAYLGCVLGLSFPLQGRAEARWIEPKTHLAVRGYSSEHGLSNLPAYHIRQDAEGFLWIANEEGLFRYDGEHFQRFGTEDGLPSRSAMYTFEDGRHRLWVQTRKELALWNGRRFETYGQTKGLPDESHWDRTTPMASDEHGMPWLTTRIGPHRLRADDRFEAVSDWPGGDCTALSSGADHNVWTASWQEKDAAGTSRVLSFEGSQWRAWEIPAELRKQRVLDILAEPYGRVWARTANDLWVLDAGSRAFRRHSALPPHPGRGGYLALDRRGGLLVPTRDALYHLQGDEWRIWGVDQGLPTSWLYIAIVDREGSMWIGGTGGLFRVLGRSLWAGATRTEGLPDNSIWSLTLDEQQHLWLGTGNGLARVTERGFELVSGTESHAVWAVTVDKTGSVWMGLSERELWSWDPRTSQFEKFRLGQGEGSVVYLAIDSDNVMWITSTDHGLYSMNLGARAQGPTRVELPESKEDEMIASVAIGKGGRLWVPGEQGLALREGGTWRRFSKQDGLLERHANLALETRSGDLLVAYREMNGVSRFRYENGKLRLVAPPSETSAASSESIYSLLEDSRGWIWIGTGRGVVLQTPEGEEQFTRLDGLISEDFNIPSFEAPTGDVWMGTTNGLVAFRAKGYEGPPTLLAPRLMEAKVNDRSISDGDHSFVSSRSNAFRGYLTSLSFANQGKIRYQVRMSSAGEEWHDLSSADVSYPILGSADYVLEARARVGHGAWSAPTTSSFRIRPTWYQNPWTRAGAILGFTAALSLLVVRVRERKVRAEKRQLEELIAVRTQELNAANASMRIVLDNVDQGLAMVDPRGDLMPERSAAFEAWFGAAQTNAHFASRIAASNPTDEAKLRIGYEQVTDGFLPPSVALDQLPKRLVVGDKHYALTFKPVIHGEKFDGTLLVITDVTSQVAALRADAIQREQIETFEWVMRDRAGFLEFFAEARALVEGIRRDRFADANDRIRAIHTLKGNAALFEAKSLAEVAHRLEQALIDEEADVAKLELDGLGTAWDQYAARTARLLGETLGEQVDISQKQLDDVIAAASAVTRGEKSAGEMEKMLRGLRGVPVRDRLTRMGAQIKALSLRFGKGVPEIAITADEIRLPRHGYAAFWSSLAHVVRNIVDHGFETADDRRAGGKTEANRAVLAAKVDADGTRVTIEIADDGRGVTWERLARRAEQAGLAHGTREELVAALFHPGISTAHAVSDTSGRGVGLSAVAEACKSLGGSVDVESEPGAGTRFLFRLPLLEDETAKSAAAAAGSGARYGATVTGMVPTSLPR